MVYPSTRAPRVGGSELGSESPGIRGGLGLRAPPSQIPNRFFFPDMLSLLSAVALGCKDDGAFVVPDPSGACLDYTDAGAALPAGPFTIVDAYPMGYYVTAPVRHSSQ